MVILAYKYSPVIITTIENGMKIFKSLIFEVRYFKGCEPYTDFYYFLFLTFYSNCPSQISGRNVDLLKLFILRLYIFGFIDKYWDI